MKKIGYKKVILFVASIFVLASCSSLPTVSQKDLNAVYIKKTEAEAKIAQLEKEHSAQLKANAEELSIAKDKVIGGQDTQIQAGADALYSIQQAAIALPVNGASVFTKDRAIEGFTAMGKPPTIKEIIEGGERLKKYLTTYQNNDPKEIEILRQDHARLVKENGILVATTEAAKKSVESARQEKLIIEQKYIADTSVAQTKLNEANNNVITKEQQRAEAEKRAKEKAESFERLKRELMVWCGVAAVLALVGAVYSPVGKGGLAAIAGAFALATICLPFIQPWMIWLVLGVILVAIAAAVIVWLKKHNLAEVANTNIVQAIQDTKEKADATVDDLKKNLKEWNTKYVRDKAGNIITQTDEAVENYIKEKLMQTGRLTSKNDSEASANK